MSSVASTTGATNPKDEKTVKKKRKPVNHNPRWKGYSFIFLGSLINFSSVSNIGAQSGFDGEKEAALAFGVFSFAVSTLVLFFDRSQLLVETINYAEALDGKLEGYMLIFLCVWWIVGAAYITQVDGVAFKANNVYFSSWLSLSACFYTLDQWSTEKDILSLGELTGISATLRSWYILFISSVVVTGTALQMTIEIFDFNSRDDAVMVFCFGVASAGIAFFWICTHYKFFECTKQGGWAEIGCCVPLILVWIIGTASVTREGGIGPNIVGNNCAGEVERSVTRELQEWLDNCTQALANMTFGDEKGTLVIDAVCQIQSLPTSENIPGSNLYFGVWFCLLSSVSIALRWKAQQALQFAQARNDRLREKIADKQENEDNDDDDLSRFEDAVDF